MSEEKPWRDEEKLRKAYGRLQSTRDVGDELGCSGSTARYWMKKFGIERSKPCKKKHGHFSLGNLSRREYSQFSVSAKEGRKCVSIHRLIAVAEYGFEEVKDKEVHHKNGNLLDNRPENLKPLTGSEHKMKHRGVTKKECKEAIRKYVFENGEEPTVRSYEKWRTNEPSMTTMYERFSSWSAAKEEVLSS